MIATLSELTYGRAQPRGDDGLTDELRRALERSP